MSDATQPTSESSKDGGAGDEEKNSPKKSEVATAPPSPPSSEPRCTFCRIIARELSSDIIYEDSDYVCFVDRSPVSTHHYLVVPRVHIRDAKALSVNQLPMIETMAELGKKMVTERGGSVDDMRLGFHWPPFLMVRHLHMHVISPASQMSWLHRNIVFRVDSLVFTSPSTTLDYLTKLLNK